MNPWWEKGAVSLLIRRSSVHWGGKGGKGGKGVGDEGWSTAANPSLQQEILTNVPGTLMRKKSNPLPFRPQRGYRPAPEVLQFYVYFCATVSFVRKKEKNELRPFLSRTGLRLLDTSPFRLPTAENRSLYLTRSGEEREKSSCSVSASMFTLMVTSRRF